MAAFGTTRYQLELETTNLSEIPPNAISKLMYYLDSICSLLDLEPSTLRNVGKFRNFKNNNLTDDEIVKLYQLCLAIPPNQLEGKCIIQNSQACGNYKNRFYKVHEIQDRFLVANSIIINGQRKRVSKIMTYKPQWLEDNYIKPMAVIRMALQFVHLNQAVDDCVIL